jgi:putative sterol carrier protein
VVDIPTRDPNQIVEFHKRLVQKLLESKEVQAGLTGEKASIGIVIKDPDVNLLLTVNGGDTTLERAETLEKEQVDTTITMRWDTALRFWGGKLDIMGALLTGAIKIDGKNLDPLFRLKSIVYKAQEASEEVAHELGWA